HQHPHIQRIQHNVRGLFQRIVDVWLCALAGGDVPLAIFRCFQLIVIVPHPMGTGLFKQIFHHTRPFFLIVSIIRGVFFCAWSCSHAGSRRLYPVSLRFSSIPPKTGVPARSGYVPSCRTDGHTSGAATSYGWSFATCGYCGQTAHEQRQAGWCCTAAKRGNTKLPCVPRSVPPPCGK